MQLFLEREREVEKVKESNSPLDLFCPSLRCKTIAFVLITLFIDLNYYSYSIAEGLYGFNPKLNQILIACS